MKRVAIWAAIIVAVGLPCRYLVPLGAIDHLDWINHQWSIGYIGEFFRAQHAMPVAFNTSQIAGVPIPAFYGNLGYPLLGLISSVTSPEVAVRIAAVAVYALQYALVVKAARRLAAPRALAHALACIVTWAIYPMTNLYNRGALLEFFATALLTCATCLGVLLVRHRDARELHRYASGTMLCLTLSAGSHPITALYGVPLLALFGVMIWRQLRNDRERRRMIVRALAPWVALAVVCLSAWVAITLAYSSHLVVARHPAVSITPESIDAWWTRFAPIPLDSRVVDGEPLSSVSSPYLDAQMNVPLLLAFVAFVVVIARGRRRAGSRLEPATWVVPVAGFVLFTALSLSTAFYRVLPGVAKMIQFGYRAITYQNLSLLCGVWLLLMAASAAYRLRGRAFVAMIGACTVLALFGVLVKWRHIAATETVDGGSELIQTADRRANTIQLPPTYYAAEAYNDVDIARLDPDTAVEAHNFTFDATDDFGNAKPMKLTFAAPTWVQTNVAMFPWQAFSIDGAPLADEGVKAFKGRMAIYVPAGTHVITFRVKPSAAWRIARAISLLATLAWCLVTLVWSLQRRSPPVDTRTSGLPLG